MSSQITSSKLPKVQFANQQKHVLLRWENDGRNPKLSSAYSSLSDERPKNLWTGFYFKTNRSVMNHCTWRSYSYLILLPISWFGQPKYSTPSKNHPMLCRFLLLCIPRDKVSPAKRCEKGYGDENGVTWKKPANLVHRLSILCLLWLFEEKPC